MEEHRLEHEALHSTSRASPTPSYCGLMACMGLSGTAGSRRVSDDDRGPAAHSQYGQASSLSAAWAAAQYAAAHAGVTGVQLQLPPSAARPSQLVDRVHAAPAQHAGVTGWLDGWKRLAEEQGCAVEGPPALAAASTMPPPHSELYLQEHVRVLQHSAHAGLSGSCHTQAFTAAPPQARAQPSLLASSPFQSASAPAALLAQMQQQAVGFIAAGRSEASSSPMKSYGSAAFIGSCEEDLLSCRSFKSTRSGSPQGAGLAHSRSAVAISQELPDLLLPSLQQQGSGVSGMSSVLVTPPQARRRGTIDGGAGGRRGTIDGGAGGRRGTIDGGAGGRQVYPASGFAEASPVSGAYGWSDSGAASALCSSAVAPRSVGIKRKSDDLLLEFLSQLPPSSRQPAALAPGGAEAHPDSRERGAEERRLQGAPPPSADFALSSFYQSGPSATAEAAAVDLALYPQSALHLQPLAAATAAAGGAGAAAAAAYGAREAAILSSYLDSMEAPAGLPAHVRLSAEIAELAWGDAELEAAALAAATAGGGAAFLPAQRLALAGQPGLLDTSLW